MCVHRKNAVHPDHGLPTVEDVPPLGVAARSEPRAFARQDGEHANIDHGGDHSNIWSSQSTKIEVLETMNNDEAIGAPTIMASEFKAKCLKLMDEVADTGQEIIISKNGRRVARLAPYRKKPKSLFGIDEGKIEILGDLIEPLGIEWEAAG